MTNISSHEVIKYKVALVSLIVFMASCASRRPKENSVQDWPEMDVLSITIEKAYKPLKDSSTVEAAERLMAQVAAEAGKLASSTLPDNVNDETVKKKLEKLRTDALALANEIATGTEDDVIGTEFHKIHDLYREIHDAWKRGSKSSL